MEIKNAKITSASIEIEDHGILTAWLHLEYGDSTAQGFGGYGFYASPKTWQKKDFPFFGRFVWRCLEIAEVGRWSDIVGKTVRVKADWGKVQAIGHITRNDWFDPSEQFKTTD